MSMLRRVLAASALLCAPTFASAALLTSVDGMTATVFQKGQSSFSGVALRTSVHAERVVKEFEIMPTFEYWRNKSTIKLYDIESSRKDATLGVDVRYRFPTTSWKPYLGVGFGLHFLTTKVNAPGLGLVDAGDSMTKGALGALGGVSFGLTERVDNFLEVKYHHLTDNRQFKINWGLSLKLR